MTVGNVMKKVIATRDPYETMVYTQDKYEGDIPSLESLAFKSIEINHLEIGSLSLSIIKPIFLRNMLWVYNDCIVKLTDIVGIRQGRFFGYTTDSKLVFLDSLVLVEKSSEKVKAAVLRLLCEEKELATGIESQCEEVNLLEYLTCPGYLTHFLNTCP